MDLSRETPSKNVQDFRGHNWTKPSTQSVGMSFNGGGGGGGRVICTHFYRKGMLEKDLWRTDMEFTFQNLSHKTVRGYQHWAIPYVRLMRKSPFAERIMYPLAKWRAEELAYQMGKVPKGNVKGKLVRLIGEPICFVIGNFVGEQNWQSLWSTGEADAK
jgi:hypothetical protein